MSLRVAVQMDPLEGVNIVGDSSFALMLSAQARGAGLWHYDVRSLAWEDGRITAWARPVGVRRVTSSMTPSTAPGSRAGTGANGPGRAPRTSRPARAAAAAGASHAAAGSG